MFRTVKQVAEHLRVSQALVYGWVESGSLPCLRLGGEGRRGTIRIDDTDLDSFLDSRRTKSQQPATKPVAAKRPKTEFKHLRVGSGLPS